MTSAGETVSSGNMEQSKLDAVVPEIRALMCQDCSHCIPLRKKLQQLLEAQSAVIAAVAHLKEADAVGVLAAALNIRSIEGQRHYQVFSHPLIAPVAHSQTE